MNKIALVLLILIVGCAGRNKTYTINLSDKNKYDEWSIVQHDGDPNIYLILEKEVK
jgi:hypothetical protein